MTAAATEKIRLVVGDRRWSTWTLRVWLVLKRLELPFEETRIPLRTAATKSLIAAQSPSGWLPVLHIDGLFLWESLAICEYLQEREGGVWPAETGARAAARCASAEMHAGFAPLRAELPMDLRPAERSCPGLSEEARGDIRRIVSLWRQTRSRFAVEGPFLFGRWCAADAFFTPVASRFATYGVDLAEFGDDGAALEYSQTLLSTAEFLEWRGGA